MTRTRLHKYVFNDHSIKFLSPDEVDQFLANNKDINVIYDGYEQELKNPPRIRDGFKPGYQPNLGMEVRHYDEYKRICKQKGCIIAGNDKIGPKQTKQQSKYINDSLLKEAVDRGANISGNEAAALKKGIKIHKE